MERYRDLLSERIKRAYEDRKSSEMGLGDLFDQETGTPKKGVTRDRIEMSQSCILIDEYNLSTFEKARNLLYEVFPEIKPKD